MGASCRRELGPLGACEQFRADLLEASVVRPWQLALAGRLAGAGYRTAVLSDHTDWLDEIEARQPFGHAFGRVFNSYYLGASKRESASFLAVLDAIGAAPDRPCSSTTTRTTWRARRRWA